MNFLILSLALLGADVPEKNIAFIQATKKVDGIRVIATLLVFCTTEAITMPTAIVKANELKEQGWIVDSCSAQPPTPETIDIMNNVSVKHSYLSYTYIDGSRYRVLMLAWTPEKRIVELLGKWNISEGCTEVKIVPGAR